MPHTHDTLLMAERLRQCNETLLSERLAHDQALKTLETERLRQEFIGLELRQVVTSLRWWAVFDLVWMVREMVEPARFAWGYPSTWAARLAVQSSHPSVLVIWFLTAAACVVPLIITLAFSPTSRWSRRCEGLAVFGLFAGGVGFATLSAFAGRLDAAHLVESYRGSTLMLIGTGLLVCCWHNSRVIRAAKAAAPKKGQSSCNYSQA